MNELEKKMYEFQKTVQTRDDFIKFLTLFRESLNKNPMLWENTDLATFLEAFQGWVADIDGIYTNRGENTPTQPTWRVLSDMLMGARVYE